MSNDAPPHHSNTHADTVFELRDLHAPKLSGPASWVAATLLESPLLGAPLRAMIVRNSGFVDFRHRAASAAQQDDHIDPCKLPIHYPLPAPAPPAQLADIDTLFHALASEDSATWNHGRPTIRTYYNAYSSGQTTPTSVARALITLIDHSNAPAVQLNAFICKKEDDVLAQAAASTNRWSTSTPLSVLDGVPYAVKTSIDVAAYPTACSSAFLTDEAEALAENDSDVVRVLREAGMIMIGKCNMDELGAGVRGFSMFTGQTRNPHNLEFVSGGSSGGCAAAVAAGLCPVSLGSDSAGSIRIPAACCGVFGLKPSFARISTHGRVLSKRDEAVDKISPLLHNGPITSCAEDLALMYYLLAGAAPHRPIPTEPHFYRPFEAVPRTVSSVVEGLRVGVCLPLVTSGSKLGYLAMRDMLNQLFEHGAEEVPVAIPNLEDIRVSLSVSVMHQFLSALKEFGYYGEGSTVTLGNDPRMKLSIGEQFKDGDLDRANVVRAKAMQYCVNTLFDSNNLDVLATPALGIDTPRVPKNLTSGLIDANTDSKLMKFANYASYLGLPACVIPITRDEITGLPRAIQFIAAPWNEGKLLEICLWAEKEFKTKNVMSPEICFNPLVGLDETG